MRKKLYKGYALCVFKDQPIMGAYPDKIYSEDCYENCGFNFPFIRLKYGNKIKRVKIIEIPEPRKPKAVNREKSAT